MRVLYMFGVVDGCKWLKVDASLMFMFLSCMINYHVVLCYVVYVCCVVHILSGGSNGCRNGLLVSIVLPGFAS